MSSGLRKQTYRAHAIRFLISGFYLILLGLVNIYGVPSIRPGYENARLLATWPVQWLEATGLLIGSPFIVFGTVLALLVAALYPLKWWTRALAFVFVFLFNAYNSSFGGVTHLYQFWLWCSFVLALMPTVCGLEKRSNRQLLLNSWLATQCMCLLFYSMSGFWKIYGAFVQFLAGEPTVFSPSGLGYHVASEIIRAGMNPLLGRLFIEHPWLSPPFAIPVALFQFASVFVIFKFKWHRLWGVGLICFHLGTFLILAITYPTNFFLVGLLFLASPFVDGELKVKKQLYRFKKLFI